VFIGKSTGFQKLVCREVRAKNTQLIYQPLAVIKTNQYEENIIYFNSTYCFLQIAKQ
jgi:hypothetical protein